MLFGATAAVAAPADAARTRISGLRELGAAFKSMNDMLRGDPPAPILIQQTARQISNAAAQMPGWFPRGSGSEAGVKTAVRPEIWSEPAKFNAAQSAFIAQAAKLRAAAEKNDLAALRGETRALGATCKSCHDSFRVPST
jgi:cytochrome c556